MFQVKGTVNASVTARPGFAPTPMVKQARPGFAPAPKPVSKPVSKPAPYVSTLTSGNKTDRLKPNQLLAVGQYLVVPGYQLIMQADGNLVLYKVFPSGGKEALWATGGPGAVRAVMQPEGNFVVYGAAPKNHVYWATDNGGQRGAFAVLQKDGNFVVYRPDGKSVIWDSGTWGGVKSGSHNSGGILGFFKDAVSTAGRVVSTAGKGIAAVSHVAVGGIKGVVDLAGHIPLVGPGIHGILSIATGPLTMTDSILAGERIDRAVMNDLKDKVHAITEVAPYVQTVVGLMPGIGTGIAGAIGAGAAMAQGLPFTAALLEGFKSAVPGGIAGKALFSMTVAAVSGDNIASAAASTALNQLGLPSAAKLVVEKSLKVAYSAAKGDNIPRAALEAARDALPSPELRKAYDVAVAVGQGKRLQSVITVGLQGIGSEQLSAIAKVGTAQFAKVPAFAAGASLLDSARRTGYEVGIGLMAHTGVNSANLNAIRSKLTVTQKAGFDMALATHIGAVKAPPSPVALAPKAQAAYLMTHGMVNANPDVKAGMMTIVAKDTEARPGAVVAVASIKKDRGWWERLLRALGFNPRGTSGGEKKVA